MVAAPWHQHLRRVLHHRHRVHLFLFLPGDAQHNDKFAHIPRRRWATLPSRSSRTSMRAISTRTTVRSTSTHARPPRTQPQQTDACKTTLDARRLPSWRNAVRNLLIPIVRWETPYLAYMQDNLRTPTLDSYFAITANLGTLTFFMVFLPILFWCGYTNLARAYVSRQGATRGHESLTRTDWSTCSLSAST